MNSRAKKSAAEKLAPHIVTGLELLALETSRETLSLLRRQVREAEERLKGAEQDLILRLDAGAIVTGDMVAIVKTEEGDCRPAWKEVYLQHMVKHGVSEKTAEAEVRKDTPRTEKRVLVIDRKA